MKDVEKIIDSIVREIPKERYGIWATVFDEKIVGKNRVPTRDLEDIEQDECFKRLEAEGFYKIVKEQSHAHNEGVFVATPNIRGANRHEARNKTFAIPNDEWCRLLLVQLKEATRPTY